MRELYAHNSSAVHQLDARVKVIFTLAFIVCLSLTPHRAWAAYILFLTVTLSAALLSRLGVRFVLRRALLAVPFALAALPLIFTGKPPLITVPLWQGAELAISPEGAERFASIAIKSWISVQAAILLSATTRFTQLLTALQQLHVPRIFIAIIGLMWRYLFVISDEVTRMLRARASRSTTAPDGRRAGGALKWRARVAGGMAGSLFLRSLERSDRVYAAMLARGYNGSLPTGESLPLTVKQWIILGAGGIALLLLLAIALLTGA